MTQARTALVIGGGIAGPATAMALQEVGIDPVVYESRPPEADGAGAFLTLASNGIEALRALGAHEPALAAGFPTPTIALRSATGRRLGETRTGHAPGEGPVSHTLMRADLGRLLAGEARARGVPIEHGRRLTEAQPTADGVRAVFADGTDAQADVLIGCDGVHSTVRGMIDPAAPAPAYAGLLGTGGVAAGVELETAPGEYELTFGRRAFFGHVATPDGHVWWFANLPSPREPTREDASAGGETLRRRLLDAFSDDAGPALELIAATPQLAPLSPFHAIPHLPRWHSDRMVVVGDAAHAPTPSSGQGASLALEDAVVLATSLRDAPDPATAFARFEAARRARVERIIKWAARVNSSKAAGPVARAARRPAPARPPAHGRQQRAGRDLRPPRELG
jgi:2-polyprenyl-6-methoxyphenol hydroxylase-like FAD-dependent oxidoreductase